MELINRKYRIIRPIDEKQNISAYLAYDILYPKKLIQLNIIEPRERTLEYRHNFYNSFIRYKSFKVHNIISDLELDRIKNIDGKRIEKNLLFFTSEFVEINSTFNEMLENTSNNERLELFIGLCQSINYLSVMDYSYPGITLDNIIFHNDGKGFILKLKSLAYLEFLGDIINIDKDESKNKLINRQRRKRDNLYELGVFLLALFKMNLNIFNCSDEENDWEIKKDSYFIHKITNISAHLTRQPETTPYKSISDTIEDINRLFDNNYKPYEMDELRKFNNIKPLIGRDNIIKDIMDIYDKNKEIEKNMFFIHGDHGIGKTHILTELKNLLNIGGANVYYSFDLENEVDEGNKKAIVKILKSIMEVSEKSLLKEYEQVLIKIIPEIYINSESLSLNKIWDFYNEDKLIEKVFEFIYKAVKDKPSVIIFDNIDYAGANSINIIQMLINGSLLNDNMVFIFSYSDENCFLNNNLTTILEKVKNNSKVVDIKLEGLTNKDSYKLIEELLPSGADVIRLNSSIYEKSKGNPKFIQESITNMYLSNSLILDESTGKWIIENRFENGNIPNTIEQIIQNTLGILDSKEIDLLGIISVFNIPVSVNIIQTLFAQKNIERILMNMVHKGILRVYENGETPSFKILSRVYKNTIYNMIAEPNRKIIHSIASQVLEDLLSIDRSSYFNELLYHLEKAGHYQKAIMYYISNTDLMDKYKNRSEAIRSLEKAIDLFEAKDKSVGRMTAMLRLGEKYIEVCKYDKAIELYMQAKSITKITKNIELYIDALIGIIRIQIVHHKIKRAYRTIKIAEEYIKKVNYLAGHLNIAYRKAYVLNMKKEYNLVIEIVNTNLPLCNKDTLGIQGDLYNIMGLSKTNLGMSEEALKDFFSALECYEVTGMVNNQIITLTNIGAIYALTGDMDNFGKCLFKGKKINKIYGHDRTEVILDINISSYYFANGMYESCIEILNKVTPLAKKTGLMTFYLICNVFLLNANVRLFNFKEAYYYFKIVANEIEKESNQGPIIEEYYFYAMMLFFEVGYFKKVAYYYDKIAGATNVDYSINEIKDIYSILVNVIQKKNIEKPYIDEILKVLKNENVHGFEKTFMQARMAMLMYDSGLKEEAFAILQVTLTDKNKINKESIIELIKKYIYISEEANINGLMELLENAISKNYSYIVIKIRLKIAEIFLQNQQYHQGIYYYIDAYDELVNMLTYVPQESQIQFLKMHNMLVPMENFLSILNISKGKSLPKKKKITNYERFENIHLDYLNFQERNLQAVLQEAKTIQRLKNEFYLDSFEDLIENFQMDASFNLQLICKYLTVEFISTRVIIATDDTEYGTIVLADNDNKHYPPRDMSIFQLANNRKAPVLFNALESKQQHIKAVICIPLLIDNSGIITIEQKGQQDSLVESQRILGYIYMEAYHTINELQKDNIKRLNKIYKIVALNIQKLISDKVKANHMMSENNIYEDA